MLLLTEAWLCHGLRHPYNEESRALSSLNGTIPSHLFTFVDDTWVKIKTQDVDAFKEHLNSVDRSIKFTREDMKENMLAFHELCNTPREGWRAQH